LVIIYELLRPSLADLPDERILASEENFHGDQRLNPSQANERKSNTPNNGPRKTIWTRN
jgi:hypothetical protein